MTGSLRLSALLLLLLSRWASADLEKGEDEFVRSWVIIEEQLVPPSRDEPLTAGGGGVAAGGASAGRRITPKSVFVAPSFNKCSDNYRPDSMGRCVKVVKLNQAAQWDFLLKQLNSMYGPGGGGGFPVQPVAAPMYRPAAVPAMTTTTAEPPAQKTDSPGPFQLNIPFGGHAEPSSDERPAVSTTTAAASTTVGAVTDDATTTVTAVSPSAGTTIDPAAATAGTEAEDDDADAVTADGPETTTAAKKLRPYRYQTTTQHAEDGTEANTVTAPYDSPPYPTTTATDVKSMYVESGSTTTAVPSKTVRPVDAEALPSSSSPPTVVTATAADDDADTEEPVTGTPATATTTEPADGEDDVVTVLAVAAPADGGGGGGRPSSSTRTPPYENTHSDAAASSEYYDDQPEEPTAQPVQPDCSVPDARRYHAACADVQQQQLQQIQHIQQQQLLLQQHQQHQQIYQQQQQQQFYQQQQQQLLLQQQHLQQLQLQQPPPQNDDHASAVRRPAAGVGAPVRFPGDGDAAAAGPENATPVRFPGSGPYRTTNKMFESSRHPTWWPTGWPEQQQQKQPQSQSDDDTIYQQHRLQYHLPQQKQDVRLGEFGSRLPKISSTTTVLPPLPPPPPTQWFHRFF